MNTEKIRTIRDDFCQTEEEKREFDSMMPVFYHAVRTALREEIIGTSEEAKVSSDKVFNTFVNIAPSIIGSTAFGHGHEYLARKALYLKLDSEVMPLFDECYTDVKNQPVL